MIQKSIQYTLMLCIYAAVGLALPAQSVFGADIQMEVFYLPHPPAMAVVSKVEDVAAEFNNVILNKYSFDDPSAEKLLTQYDLQDHMPVAIFLNGHNSFTLNGQKIVLRNFPKGDPFVPMFAGSWDYTDLRLILEGMNGGK